MWRNRLKKQPRSDAAIGAVYFGKTKSIFSQSGIVWLTLPRNDLFILDGGFYGCQRHKETPAITRLTTYTKIDGRYFPPVFAVCMMLLLKNERLFLLLLHGLRSFPTLCNRPFNYIFLHYWNVAFCSLWIGTIIYNSISCHIGIIYFYILRQYSLTV